MPFSYNNKAGICHIHIIIYYYHTIDIQETQRARASVRSARAARAVRSSSVAQCSTVVRQQRGAQRKTTSHILSSPLPFSFLLFAFKLFEILYPPF